MSCGGFAPVVLSPNNSGLRPDQSWKVSKFIRKAVVAGCCLQASGPCAMKSKAIPVILLSPALKRCTEKV